MRSGPSSARRPRRARRERRARAEPSRPTRTRARPRHHVGRARRPRARLEDHRRSAVEPAASATQQNPMTPASSPRPQPSIRTHAVGAAQHDGPSRGVHDPDLMDLVRAVQALPTDTRRVFTLRHVYGCSHEEIGKRLGMSLPAVEAHLVTAAQGFARASTARWTCSARTCARSGNDSRAPAAGPRRDVRTAATRRASAARAPPAPGLEPRGFRRGLRDAPCVLRRTRAGRKEPAALHSRPRLPRPPSPHGRRPRRRRGHL